MTRPLPTPPDWSGHTPQTLVPVDPQPMTDWFHPAQLAATAVQVLVSSVLGQQADHRIMEALTAGPEEGEQPPDYGAHPTCTIDYLADTGDGWDATYTLAYHLAQPVLAVAAAGGGRELLARGQVLIFGGDEVYPVAGRAEYERRLVAPFETAMALSPGGASAPDVYAIPGNHDWYDSLVAFTRLFIGKRWFAAWRSRQTRSYFALPLPHGWWLMGVDVQLDSDLDIAQVDYFERVAKHLQEGDRIILCLPEPHWIYEQERATGHWDRAPWERPQAPTDGATACRSNLDYLEQKLFRNQVAVMLAGDLHHYRRHAHPDGRQKIVAGGGGAFLHATHPWSETPLVADGSELKAVWPSPTESRSLIWNNLKFPFLHWRLGLLIGLCYLLINWTLQVDLSGFGIREIGCALQTALLEALLRPGGAFLMLGLLGAFILFAAPERKRFRRIAGLIHGLGHLALCFLLGWGVTRLTVGGWHLPFQTSCQLLLGGLLVFLGGALFGTLLFGCYLAVSLNVFKYHWTEGSSGLASPDWKCFLRLRIDEDGALTIFPIGFRRTPRRWKPGGSDPTKPRLEPDDPEFTGAELIEPPIRIPGRRRP